MFNRKDIQTVCRCSPKVHYSFSTLARYGLIECIKHILKIVTYVISSHENKKALSSFCHKKYF